MLRTKFTEDANIPQLAYLVRVRDSQVLVIHGRSVTRTSKFWTDGVWSGPFDEAPDFEQDFLAGTMGVITNHGVRIASPRNPTDRLFLNKSDSTVVVSNSLPLILAALEDRLDPDVLTYRSRFRATSASLRWAPRTFPTLRKRTIRVLWDEIGTIGSNGTVKISPRPPDNAFTSFTEYKNHLVKVSRTLLENALDSRRPTAFEPLVALSTGYDSTATAAIARQSGVRSAITMLRPTPGAPPGTWDDHPGEIARQLDIDLVEVQRDQWRDRTDLPDAEIAAASTDFIDIPLLALEEHLPGRLLLVGNSGDNVWDLNNSRAYPDIVRGDTSGQGLSEHRLRVGYAFCSIPYIGHTAQASILDISRSDEMRPWSTGTSYDRPIPRRIVEDAGVDRELFGQKKFAGGALVGTNRQRFTSTSRSVLVNDLSSFMTHRGAEEYAAFIGQVRPHERKRKIMAAGTWLYHKLDAVNHRIGTRFATRGIRHGLAPRRMASIASRFLSYPDLSVWFPHWGTSVLIEEYSSVTRHLGVNK